MIPYIIVALVPVVMNFTNFTGMNEKRNKNLKIFLSLLPMFFLIAFRNQKLGYDTNAYLTMFSDFSEMPFEEIFNSSLRRMDYQRLETGYILFCRIIGFFTRSQLAFQIIYSVIYLISVYVFCKHIEGEPFWFIFFFCTLGCYTFMFTGVRQCLAICICLLSYPLIKKKKLIFFLLMVALAYTFHKSSIVFLIVYFMYHRKLTWWNILLYAFIAVLCVIYLDIINDFVNDQLDYHYTIEETGNGWIFFAFILVFSIASAFVLILFKKNEPETIGAINIGAITIILWLLRVYTRAAERPSFYVLPFSFIMCGKAMEAIPNKKLRAAIALVIFSISMAYYIYRFTAAFSFLTPYSFYQF